jgi:Cysteine-rich secretory protein family
MEVFARKLFVMTLLVAGLALPVVAQRADENAAREIFRLLNQERTQGGLPALQWDDRLANAAVDHTRLLAEHKELSHQFNHEPALRQRYVRYNIRLDRAGENVAYDSTVEGAHEGFMHSPPHRANILSPDYDAVGVGVIFSGDRYYVTQDFAHMVPEMASKTVEDEIATRVQQVRAQQRQAQLKRVTLAEVRGMACRMAKDDRPEPELARSVGGARYFVAYTMTDPKQLPSNLTNLRTASDVDRFAVGACFQSTPSYPNGVYWVMVVFLQGSRRPLASE